MTERRVMCVFIRIHAHTNTYWHTCCIAMQRFIVKAHLKWMWTHKKKSAPNTFTHKSNENTQCNLNHCHNLSFHFCFCIVSKLNAHNSHSMCVLIVYAWVLVYTVCIIHGCVSHSLSLTQRQMQNSYTHNHHNKNTENTIPTSVCSKRANTTKVGLYLLCIRTELVGWRLSKIWLSKFDLKILIFCQK